ncbi:MAG TPA: histidine phosphatase family protein [Xanthobacteraceae bacterium]
MRLMLLRHAKAEKADGGMRDRDRPLNGRGRSDAAEIAAYMVERALAPERVVVSSAQRTRETWARMAPAFSTAPAVDYEDRLYDARTEAIVSVIKAAGGKAAALMVIGHNPGLHDTARLLLAHRGGTARQLDEGLPTAGLVVIDFAVDNWNKLAARSGRLKGFITPRLLRSAQEKEEDTEQDKE